MNLDSSLQHFLTPNYLRVRYRLLSTCKRLSARASRVAHRASTPTTRGDERPNCREEKFLRRFHNDIPTLFQRLQYGLFGEGMLLKDNYLYQLLKTAIKGKILFSRTICRWIGLRDKKLWFVDEATKKRATGPSRACMDYAVYGVRLPDRKQSTLRVPIHISRSSSLLRYAEPKINRTPLNEDNFAERVWKKKKQKKKTPRGLNNWFVN